MDENKAKERRIVSEEVYDQINSRPPWIIRNGLGSIFLLITLATTSAALISYPETVPVSVKLVPSMKPFRLEISDTLSPKTLIPSGHQVVAGEQVAITQTHDGTHLATLRSPVTGKFNIGYDYDKMSTILQITPDSTTYVIWGEIDDSYAEKVAIGMNIRVRLPSGSIAATYLHGKISGISSFAVDHRIAVRISPHGSANEFAAKFSAPNGSLTSTGDLEISNTSILSRVFVQFFHLKRFNR
ncbi:MAG TPA: hypothetical protein VMH27_15815 [Puia sp.]|nr:hypothetical protein [Puia sp.]